MKTSTDEQLARRFYVLSLFITIVLLAVVGISVSEFGAGAWESKKQIGFIMMSDKDEPGWNRVHYRGIQSACTELGYDLLLRENVSTQKGACVAIVRELAEKGVNVIFFINAQHLSDAEDLTKEYPRIRFYSIDYVADVSNIDTYSVRYYEPRYLSGIIAGLRTKTNRIGYIAPFSNPKINRGINAFTLGVQRVNPDAQVFVSWTGSWSDPEKERQSVRNLKAERADVIAYHQHGSTIPDAAERAGLDFVACYESYPSHRHYMTAVIVDWKSVYIDILKHYNRNSRNKDDYWYGIINHITDIDMAKAKLTDRERVHAETARWELTQGKPIFAGEIYDRNGVLRSAANESISSRYLQNDMNWLVRGVNVIGN